MEITILFLICFVNFSFGKVLPTEFQQSSSVFEGQWVRSSQANVEIIPHDPIVERGANLTLRCVAHGIKHVQDYMWKVPFHMLMDPFKLAERDRKRTLEVMHVNDKDHNKKFVCEVTNHFGTWTQSVTLRILELMHPHSTQSVTLGGLRPTTINYDRKAKSEGEEHGSGIGTAVGVGLVMGFIGICIGIFLAVILIRRRQSCKVPNLDGAAKRRLPGRTITPDEHYMSLNQHLSTNTSSTASSDRYQVDLGLPVYHQKPPLPPPRVVKPPVPPFRKRHYKHADHKIHREAMSKSKSMDSVYDSMKRSHQTLQEYVKPTELQYASCEYMHMLANLRNPTLQQTNNNNPRISLVDTYTTPAELFRDNLHHISTASDSKFE